MTLLKSKTLQECSGLEGESDYQSYHIMRFKISSFQQKSKRRPKKQENIAHLRVKKCKLTHPWGSPLVLLDKDFKSTVFNKLKDIKEIIDN